VARFTAATNAPRLMYHWATYTSCWARALTRYFIRAVASDVYLLSGNRVASSLKALNESRAERGSRSAGSCFDHWARKLWSS
jgi:hypothetical protein